MKTIYDWLENRGIHVKDREKILEAFTHSSFANEHHRLHNNERLEFMGDAVLQLWSSNAIWPLNLSEGQMTRLRASIVCEPTLALCAKDIKLSEYIMLGKGEEQITTAYSYGTNENRIRENQLNMQEIMLKI